MSENNNASHFDGALMSKLASSEGGRVLGGGPRSSGFDAAAKKYAADAIAAGLHPAYWVIKPTHGYLRQGRLAGVMSFFLSRTNTGAALAVFAEAGCSPWLISADFTGVMETMQASDMARGVMGGGDWPLTTRRLALKSALGSLPKEVAVLFLKELRKRYDDVASRSSKTSKGVLGRADKEAKDCASVIVHSKAALLAAGAATEKLFGVAGLAADVEALVKDAEACVAVKADKSNAAVNPEKVKKQLSEQQRVRASSLMMLCRERSEDGELIKAAFEATPWLSEIPMAASVKLGREGSIFSAVMEGRSAEALAAMEKCGANIWLAAAQAGESNACVWVARMASRSGKEFDLPATARMLMIGSWLDGAPDPKARCLELAREAEKTLDGGYSKTPKEAASRLAVEIERLTLNELLESYSGQEAGKSPEPARRRSSL